MDYQQKLKELTDRYNLIRKNFSKDQKGQDLDDLQAQSQKADFWQEPQKAQSVMKKIAVLDVEINTFDQIATELHGLEAMVPLAESDPQIAKELEEILVNIEKKLEGLESKMFLSGPYDANFAIVSIHAGQGGVEAMDWVAMLSRMYQKYFLNQKWNFEVIDEIPGEEAGFKTVSMTVNQSYAYGLLRREAGVHRLVRISPFDAEKMRHTSFALVEVIPELEEISETEIDLKDLRIDTFMSGGKGGQSVNTTYSAVRIVHIPTNITVQCQNERSQQQNKETALKVLASRLHNLAEIELESEKKKLRGEFKGAEWGNQIRSYVLQPYQLVKDHRTDFETPDTQGVLNGELDLFVEAYLRKQLGDLDRWAEENREN